MLKHKNRVILLIALMVTGVTILASVLSFQYNISQIKSRQSRMKVVLSWMLSDRLKDDVVAHNKRILSWRCVALWANAPQPNPPEWESSWDSPVNYKLSETSPRWFCDAQNPHTRLMAIRGEGTVFDNNIEKIIDNSNYDGQFIILVEIHGNLARWTQPGDIYTGTRMTDNHVDYPVEILERQSNDYFVGFSDGEAWLLSKDTPMEVLAPFLRVSDASLINRDKILAPYRVR